MSTASRTPRPASHSSEPDPFRYGWRFVKVKQPDGAVELEQVPLTLEDVLFPEEGDFIVQSVGHANDVIYLANVFRSRLADDPEAVVLCDCRTDWNLPDVRPLGPDVSVFFGVPGYEDWSTFDVAEEGARPALVVEVTSPETRTNDVGPKMEYYHDAGVPLYVVADVRENEQERQIRLLGFSLARRGYEPLPLNPQGRLWLEPLRVWLGVTRDQRGGFDRLACYDPETGEELGDYVAVSQQLAEWKARADSESKARAEAEQAAAREAQGRTAAEAKARLEAQARTAAEQAAAREVQARTAAEQAAAREVQARTAAEAMARSEAQARAEAEEKLRALQAELERLRQGG